MWQDEMGELLSFRLHLAVTEYLFRGRIPVGYPSLIIHKEDGIVRICCDPLKSFVALPEGFLQHEDVRDVLEGGDDRHWIPVLITHVRCGNGCGDLNPKLGLEDDRSVGVGFPLDSLFYFLHCILVLIEFDEI